MLKSQFAKVFYLCNSFLLVTFSPNISPAADGSICCEKEINGTYKSLTETCKLTADNIRAVLKFNPKNKSAQFNSGRPQIQMNRNETVFARKYLKNSSVNLSCVKKRSSIPFSIIDSVFMEYGLPVELKYLAVIESELKPTATSCVGARGPWQIMPATAHILGLKTSRNCDERTNYYKSTIAAAKYLRDLYVKFDDWLLVLAAYNGGPKPVLTAMHESGSKNFWVLQNYLPAESREHVKKFIATHYYFEGRGSETTLTKAENKMYRKMLASLTDGNGDFSGSDPIINNEMKLPFGFYLNETGNSLTIFQNISVQNESSEAKFKRVMRESEECLKKSGKII